MYLTIFLILTSLFIFNNLNKLTIFKKHYSTSDEFLADSNTNKKPHVITGTGIVFLILFIISNIFLYFFENEILFPNRYIFFIISLIFLTIFSFYDDYKPLDPILRLTVQLLSVYISLASLNLGDVSLPLKVTMFFAIIIWVYIINVTNFIDGSDGFCALNIIAFFSGLLIINYFVVELFSANFALLLLPVLLIFLIFNFPNAKIYMGDTGAVFLGFLVGFSFLEIAINFNFLIAVILFIYPLLDCTITIIKKLKKGFMPWARHGDYFFLELKKKTPFKLRKKIAFYILKTSLVQNILNILFLCLAIYLKNNLILIFNFAITFTVLLIFYKKKNNL
jgi:UDP-N-acetylmuramyl pentapeptide phosphotransferase/UDP-N-acetylglucosamine-1-phosphate transferase